MDFKRIARHVLLPDWMVRRTFSAATLHRIEAAIRESEKVHSGELRFAAEAGLDLMPLLKGMTPRQRAVEVFSQLRVWDTVHNSGVLIYVQLVDRDIEIIADRGINARVQQSEWDAVCRRMEASFRAGDFEAGAVQGIREITALLAMHFPPGDVNTDELPDRPVLL